MNKNESPPDVDAYIAQFPEEVQEKLSQIRSLIKSIAPQAQELMAYGMPAYKFNGPLIYFAGYKNHIGFYATPTGHTAFAQELATYKQGKGSVQFPLDQALPLDLIQRIVEYRLLENQTKAKKNTK